MRRTDPENTPGGGRKKGYNGIYPIYKQLVRVPTVTWLLFDEITFMGRGGGSRITYPSLFLEKTTTSKNRPANKTNLANYLSVRKNPGVRNE